MLWAEILVIYVCLFLKDMSQEAEASQQLKHPTTVVISTTYRLSHCKDLNGLPNKTTGTNQECLGD